MNRKRIKRLAEIGGFMATALIGMLLLREWAERLDRLEMAEHE